MFAFDDLKENSESRFALCFGFHDLLLSLVFMRGLRGKLTYGRVLQSRAADCELSESHSAGVVVIGSGGAGLRAAIEAADEGASTMLASNGGIAKSGATMIAGADITLDGGGAAKIGLVGNEDDTEEKFFHDILVKDIISTTKNWLRHMFATLPQGPRR